MATKLLLGACLALSLAACATHPSAPVAGKSTVAATPQTPFGCVANTGTKFNLPPGACAGFGTSHSQNSILYTGEQSPGRALQTLDPTVQAKGTGQ